MVNNICDECKQGAVSIQHTCDSGQHRFCSECWAKHERKHKRERLCLPTVHLNGTSREELIRQRIESGTAILNAINVLSANGPHMRDYYVVPGSWKGAREKHGERIRTLDRIYNELRDEYDALNEEE